MTEWIILTWITACSRMPTSFKETFCPDGNTYRFFISTSTANFEEKWNSLSGKERETARVFRGKEYNVKTFLELSNKKIDFDKTADQAEKETDKKFCNLGLHQPKSVIYKTLVWPPEKNTEFSVCEKCGKKIKKNVMDELWELDE